MVARRDELDAYAFARKRTAAAFLRPSSSQADQDRDGDPASAGGWPRALRAIGPSLVAGALLLVGFGVWGLLKPAAPVGWDEAGAKILVGSESATRYVVLKTDGAAELHPVLNLASARLLLDPRKFGVLTVDEAVLDSGRIPRGATLGIPYAPDRLPGADDAGTAKKWSVCEQPGPGSATSAQKAAFVLAARDAPGVDGTGRLHGRQALYVQGPDGTPYLVDSGGTRFLLAGQDQTQPATGQDLDLLLRALFGRSARPQMVTADWLDTLNSGPALAFPRLDGLGSPAGVPGLSAAVDKVGMVLTTAGGHGARRYVVLPGTVAPVSDLMADLLLAHPDAQAMYPGPVPEAQQVAARDLAPGATPFGDRGLPRERPQQANTGSATTVCSVYLGSMGPGGRTRLGMWAGSTYPLPLGDAATSAYVTPGTGLLYREVGSGAVYLITDTGLRYALPSRRGTLAQDGGGSPGGSRQAAGEAQTRLGYGTVSPVPVPPAFAAFLPVGPTLDTDSALRPQGS